MNYPRSVGVDPATGNIWVVNYEGRPFTSVYDNDFNFLFTVDTVKFSQDIDFHDGLAYMVVRRTPAGVRIYDAATGAEVRQCCGNYGNLRGIAVDPANGNMWLTSDSSNALYVVDRNGAQLQKLAVDKRAWGIDIVGDVVYVADASANKVIAFDRTTYQRLGSFGSAGKGLGQFKGPSGITHDDQGRLYVVEDRGARDPGLHARSRCRRPSPTPPALPSAGSPPPCRWSSPAPPATIPGWVGSRSWSRTTPPGCSGTPRPPRGARPPGTRRS